MLEQSFLLLTGIGVKTERRLWSAGVHCWDDLLARGERFFAPGTMVRLVTEIDACRQALAAGDAVFFERLLPPGQHWRLFPHFRPRTGYLDIETTGDAANQVTTVAVFDGAAVSWYVRGRNLDQLAAELAGYDVLVTFNGRRFDVPVLRAQLGLALPQAQIDLVSVLRALGLKGGLKACERSLGLDRGPLDGLDGYAAVLLWQEFQRSGCRAALDTLLAYNIEDTVNLEALLVEAYNRHRAATPLVTCPPMPAPGQPLRPILPDPSTVARLKARLAARRTAGPPPW
ncbi:MAG: ribonuclease H-like domain-containing protein [Thermodesulfobacteriota bacterium]